MLHASEVVSPANATITLECAGRRCVSVRDNLSGIYPTDFTANRPFPYVFQVFLPNWHFYGERPHEGSQKIPGT